MNAPNPGASRHDKDLRTLGEDVRLNIVMMIVSAMVGGLEDEIESRLRAVRRRWDELCPPNAADRKTWPKDLLEQRTAWDTWFQRFMAGQGTVEGLLRQIQIVNAATRPGVKPAEPITGFQIAPLGFAAPPRPSLRNALVPPLPPFDAPPPPPPPPPPGTEGD